MSLSKEKVSPEAQVQTTIDQIKKNLKQNPDPKNFDEILIKNLEMFMKNENFFSLPAALIGRVLKNANRILTPEEANRALKLHIKFLGESGIGLLMFLNCGNISGGEALEALKGIEGFPIITQLCTQPFLAPPPPKSLHVQELEEDIEKLKGTILSQYERYQRNTILAEDLTKEVTKLEAYKKRNPHWVNEFKILKEKYKEVKTYNQTLKADNTKWREAAFTKPLVKPKNFIDDIFRATEAGDIASVEYLVESNPKLCNLKQDDEILQTWTPLLIALKNNNFDLIKILVEHGADVNIRTNHGTPLFYASKFGTVTYQYLIDHGATRE